MYQVGNLNQGVTSLGYIKKSLTRAGINLHIYFVSK